MEFDRRTRNVQRENERGEAPRQRGDSLGACPHPRGLSSTFYQAENAWMSSSNNDSLSPGDSSDRPVSAVSTSSSLGGLYDSYLTSPRASTSGVALGEADDFRLSSGGITSAHRRNSSPVPLRAARSVHDDDGGLHRRSPSRIHARERSSSYAPPADGGLEAD